MHPQLPQQRPDILPDVVMLMLTLKKTKLPLKLVNYYEVVRGPFKFCNFWRRSGSMQIRSSPSVHAVKIMQLRSTNGKDAETKIFEPRLQTEITYKCI